MSESNNQEITERTQEISELYKEIEDAVNEHMIRTGKWPSQLRIGEAIWDEIKDEAEENSEFLDIPVSIVGRDKDPSDFFRYAMQ